MGLSFNFKDKHKSKEYKREWRRLPNKAMSKIDTEKPKLDASQYENKIWYDGKYWDVNVLEERDIINQISDITEEERKKLTSIVFNAELFCKETLLNECVAHLPYVGTFKINAGKRYLEKHAEEIKQHYTPEMNNRDRLKVRIDFYKQGWREFSARQNEKSKEDHFRKMFKKEYDECYKVMGKSYAEHFIHSMTLLEFIPFDQDFEDAFQNAK